MKQRILLLLMVTTMASYAQKPDLMTVNTVKPKNGQKMAFEAAYKAHVAKFHGTDKVNVYEIMSGQYAGYYNVVDPPMTFADIGKQRADAAAHNLDLDKSFFPLLEETRNGTYQTIDSCGIRPPGAGGTAEAFVVTIRHLKEGLNIQNYRRELARASKLRTAQKSPFWENFSATYYEQLWDGSDQITVTVRSLKDGFKSLAPNFYPADAPGTPSFRDDYSKKYGNEAWDDRTKLLEDAVVKTEQYIMRWRKDLSSK